MKKVKHLVGKILLVVLSLGVALSFSIPALAQSEKEKYTVYLHELNDSNVWGKAKLTVEGNMLTVKINAHNLEPNMVHPQHIHGFANDANATCPTPSADTNNDGVVDLGEGLPSYGPVMLSLEPFPVANTGSNIHYKHHHTHTMHISMLEPLENRTIVLHGMTVNGQYVATLPVACGQITLK